MSSDENIKSNIGKYYLTTSLASFGFFTPIIQLFYLSNDLTIFNIAILGVIWTVVKMIAEIPSSILADKWGRKNVMLISSIFAILQLLTLMYSKSYPYFVLASVWSALSYAFMSGTNIAFFYDTLKVLGKEKEFDRLWAKQQIYSQIPFFVAFVSSGFLYSLSPLLPFQLSFVFLVLSLMVMLTFSEPKFYKPVEEELKFLTFLKQSMQYVFKNQYLKFALIYTIIFSLGSDMSYGYGQIYLNQLSTPIMLFGIIYTIKSLLCTIGANMSATLRKKISFRGLFGLQIIMLTLLLAVMVLTSNFVIGAICFVLIAIPHGLFEISKSSYMHQHIDSHQRATVDSMFSFFMAMLFLIIEPIFGYMSDIYSIKIPFLIITIIMSIYDVYYLLNGYKRV